MGREFLSPLEEFKGVKDRFCCLTGDFNYGPKTSVEEYIRSRNGKIRSGLTGDTTVLVVGEKGNANWAHGNYGRKVEKALLARKEGKGVCIIAEDDFFRLMESMPDGGEAPQAAPIPEKPYSVVDDLATAKDCFDDVVNGLIPITDPDVADYLAYASGILGILLDEHWKPKAERKLKKERKRKRPFFMTREQAAAIYTPRDELMSASGIALELSAGRPDMSSYRCSAWGIYKWLESQGYLTFIDTEDGRITRITSSGESLGLSMGKGFENNSAYIQFDRRAQQFLIDHIEDVCIHSFTR